jgi:hypothetical protein
LLGADETVDYKASEDEQISKLQTVTNGKLHRIFDATSKMNSFVFKYLKSVESEPGTKYFSTTDDWQVVPYLLFVQIVSSKVVA